MKRRYLLAFIAGICATIALSLGITTITSIPVSAQNDATILVSAAASLQEALEDIKPLFEAAHTNVQVNYNFGSSGTLQQQIEQGAPADVFFSAATRQMDALQTQNLILPDTRRTLLTNHLVLIVLRNSSLGLTSFRQLTQANVRRIAMGEPRSVPAGQYAQEFLTHLGIWDQIQSKLVLGNNVRNVLAAVESGNADAGLVYTTDARISNQVTQVATAPDDMHSPIVYPVAVLRGSSNQSVARQFVQFLESDRALQIFQRYGFGVA
jgi:molybdate transport system substrate-binding protein